MADPAAYFLDADQVDDDLLFLAPARAGVTVTPLYDGIETFRAMEVAIAGATRTVHMAAWLIDPAVALRDPKKIRTILAKRAVAVGVGSGASGAGSKHVRPPVDVKNWGELLTTVAGFGVEVCVLLSDFDPILQPAMHEMTWSSCRKLQALAKARSRGNFQVLASQHQHALGGWLATIVAQKLTRDLVAKLNTGGRAQAAARFNDLPAAWKHITRDPVKGTFTASSTPSASKPVSHHQKICIVDQRDGFCGGLDVAEGRLDTKSQHLRGWHDLHCRVNGQLAADLDRNFVARWNAELPAANMFVASAAAPVANRADKVTAIAMPAGVVHAGSGAATGQLVRTFSRPSSKTMPNVERDDILRTYQRAIGLAEQFIYLENQYVRDIRLADWLIARAAAKPDLAIILVLPVAPEEIVDPPDKTDEGTKHGLYLQREVLDALSANPKVHFRAFSMLQQLTSKWPKHPTNYLGSTQVYVHSKLMIVDDIWATVGSANLNPRSLAVDTEANIAWVDPAGVKKLRLALWREMLGSPALEAWKPTEFVAQWDAIAQANKAARPEGRAGYVVPHDRTNLDDAQRKSTVIPNGYAEIDAIDPDPHVLV